jgi:hypothetical protein
VIGRAEFFGEDVVVVVVGVLLGRVLADVLDVLVHLEGLLVDVVGELFLLAALGTRTHVPHYIFKFKGWEGVGRGLERILWKWGREWPMRGR